MSEISQKSGLTLEFKFLAGQYHATKWGHNVNEGIIDWPPSPWRIMRAIISSWKIYLEDIENSEMEPILSEMCRSKISFKLPNAIQSHTRHYMPIKGESEKIIDSFMIINKDECLYAHWHALNLEKGQKETLEKIVNKIKYLGRAESWCSVQIVSQDIKPNCIPLEDCIDLKHQEIVSVIVPATDASISDLCTSTKDIYDEKRSQPNGSRFIQYVRPLDELANIQDVTRVENSEVGVVRYTIVGKIRPKITETIHVGDFVKRVVMSVYGKRNNGEVSITFSGKDSDRKKLSGHMHAYYLPTDEDEDGVLDHLTIIAKNPFNRKELDALNIMDAVRYENRWFNLIYQAHGKTTNFVNIPILETAKKWESATPFVLNRHMKLRGRGSNKRLLDGPEDQLRSEIAKRFGDKVKIRNVKINDAKSKMRSGISPIQFKRWRKSRLPGFGAYNVQIEFKEEMQGPLSFGHGSHFGLGLFVPATPATNG